MSVDKHDFAGTLGVQLGATFGVVVTWILDNWFKLALVILLYMAVGYLDHISFYLLQMGRRYYQFTSFMHGWLTGPHQGP